MRPVTSLFDAHSLYPKQQRSNPVAKLIAETLLHIFDTLHIYGSIVVGFLLTELLLAGATFSNGYKVGGGAALSRESVLRFSLYGASLLAAVAGKFMQNTVLRQMRYNRTEKKNPRLSGWIDPLGLLGITLVVYGTTHYFLSRHDFPGVVLFAAIIAAVCYTISYGVSMLR